MPPSPRPISSMPRLQSFRSLKKPAAVTFAALATALLVSGCASTPEPGAQQRASLPAAHPTEGLVGRWGVASYRRDQDRARTEAQARTQCRQPYVITKGPTDGVMMHIADDATPYELKLKGSPDGKTYLGFDVPAGDRNDREVVSFSPSLVVLRFINPEIAERYGTMVYVRCPG